MRRRKTYIHKKDSIFSKETESPESLLRLEASVIQGLISQSCLTLCDPNYCSPAGSSLRGISRTRILEWVAIPSSRGFSLTQGSNPCVLWLLLWQEDSLPLSHLGSPLWYRAPAKWKLNFSSSARHAEGILRKSRYPTEDRKVKMSVHG